MEKGLFSIAFFNLSIGLERLLKLIYLIDFAQTNGGSFPSDKAMRKLGHDLEQLFAEAEAIGSRLSAEGAEFEFVVPDPELATRIVGVLSEFAKATRYYNIDYLVGDTRIGRDPLAAWTDDVARYLMSEYPMRLRKRDEDWAGVAKALIDDAAIVHQETEDGSPINTLSGMILHGRRGEWVQRNATFHSAAIVRGLVQVIWALEDRPRSNGGVHLPMLHEFFTLFYNGDSYLRKRTTFLE